MVPRSAGGLLLSVALCVVAIGHLQVAPTAGIAVAMPVTGPPRTGDCVVSAPDPSVDLDTGLRTDTGIDTGIDTAIDTAMPAVMFGSCSGSVAGEIVSVTAGRPARQDGEIGVLMGTGGACWEAASRYAGLRVADGIALLPVSDTTGVPADPIRWLPTLRVRGQSIRAGARQRAAGRDWSACLVRPDHLSLYLGSVRDALTRGAAPAAFGDCAQAGGLAAQAWVQCSHPHTSERLGWAAVPTGSQTLAAVRSACRALAVHLMEAPDPTYGGALEIVVLAGDVTSCSVQVRGPGRLTRSLIGIGGRPLSLSAG